MRNENTLLGDEISCEQDHQGLRSEQMHLEKVTKELGDMSCMYNDSSRSGNSVERVLALELELAEAFQAKKKSTIQFQSYFLKLHSDEAAIFHSFRDINELIKDLLEMKERYSVMESELKGMHERYSQLSLDFSEVQGERQKLTITLKNDDDDDDGDDGSDNNDDDVDNEANGVGRGGCGRDDDDDDEIISVLWMSIFKLEHFDSSSW
ncbi:hypothetical protein SOVF_114180 [Spinacia oleracea]|nr:hypothetical protein SOVF_114180 [Spinacia oleracea]